MTVYPSFSVLPPLKHYGVVFADPAWRFKTFAPPKEDQKGRRDVERHYPTMTLDEIKAIPVRDIAARDAWLMMWCTWPFLEHGLATMRSWGFRYSSSFKVWFKMKKGFSPTREFITLPRDAHMGTGYTTRKNSEFILLGRRGSPKRILGPNGKPHTIVEPLFAPVREHSRKPDSVIDDILRFAPGPYIELNARTAREGWDQWGNEVGKFEAPAVPILTMVEAPAAQVDIFQFLGAPQ